ncbi:MAG: hypothetical protein RLY30_640 [Pseudomonadota bacterium]
MRIGFAGTPGFAARHLQALIAHAQDHGDSLVAVFSQPDRAAGRGRRLTPSPVSEMALAEGLPRYTPLSFRADREGGLAAQEQLRALELDLLVVVAYGLILPQAVLDSPRYGCINVHASLLPRWRGAAPIQRAIEAGDQETGVCIMQMEAGLDTGPVWLEQALTIGSLETASELQDRLAEMGAGLLTDFLRRQLFLQDSPRPQSSEGVTYAHKITAEDRRVRFHQTAERVLDQIRALESVPGATAELREETFKLGGAVLIERQGQWGPAGTIVQVGAREEGLVVACEQGLLGLSWLQRPGGRPQPGAVIARAMGLQPGERFMVDRAGQSPLDSEGN